MITFVTPDAFDILGLQPTFTLEPSAIRRAYLARVATLHPDSADPNDADRGRTTAALHQAKATLEDPERRAAALLARLGGPTKEQDKSLPPGFLMETLEMRERIEAALSSGDPEARASIQRDAASRRGAHIARVTELFLAASTPPTDESLRAIRTELNAWRYVERLIEQLDPGYDPAREQRADQPRPATDTLA